ncbi:MAG: hypothetical protein ACRD0B_04935 [Acidimicrobiales bacterium]
MLIGRFCQRSASAPEGARSAKRPALAPSFASSWEQWCASGWEQWCASSWEQWFASSWEQWFASGLD